jgi:multicomponent Na+:H+ antiporter subunit E
VRRVLAGGVVLALVYALTLASFHPLDLALGFVLGAGLTAGLRRFPGPTGGAAGPSGPRRALAFPPFALAVLADVARDTWDMTLRVVHLHTVERPGLVLVPIGERTPLGVAVTALATNLSPGSVLVEVDWRRDAMLMHVIDASDPEAVRAQFARFYERWQRPVFP